MKMKKISLYLSVALINTLLMGCELPRCDSSSKPGIIYRQAVTEDAHKILSLIESHTPDDEKKIYILPKKFRLDEVKSSIEKGHTFVACDQNCGTVLGYKKLFLIEDKQTLHNVLEEMGYSHDNHIDTSYFTDTDNYKTRTVIAPNSLSFDTKNPHIYIDMDFTDPEHRGKGINKGLTAVAFISMQQKLVNYINTNQSEKLIVSYGLSGFNDYNLDVNNIIDTHKSRTPGIAQFFALFAKIIKNIINQNNSTDNTVYVNRYHTGMPLYDEHSTENKPLPQDQWIPSSGNFLSINLR